MLKLSYMKKSIMYLSLIMALLACNDNKKASHLEEKHNSRDFGTIVSMETYAVEVDKLMEIKEWVLTDTTLICKNGGGDPFYYVFSTTNFHVIGEFGSKGNGESEWISPHLMPITDTTYIVIDNFRWGVYNVKQVDGSYVIQRERDMGVQIPLNSQKYLSRLTFGNISYSPREVVWKIMDIETLACLDSIIFFDESKGDNSMLYDFAYDSAFGHAVFAYRHLDGFMVTSLSDGRQVIPEWIIKGDGKERMNGNSYYTDVVCGKKYFYLLSLGERKSVDFSENSFIEIYDYEGNPVKKINLDIQTNKMVYDKINKKVIFQSSIDNDFHVLDYEFE